MIHLTRLRSARNSQGCASAVVGRKVHCEVTIGDAHISSLHCVVESAPPENGPAATVKDLSTNGVFLNTQRIGKGNSTLARSGDMISFVVIPTLTNGIYTVSDINLVGRQNPLPHSSLAPHPNRGAPAASSCIAYSSFSVLHLATVWPSRLFCENSRRTRQFSGRGSCALCACAGARCVCMTVCLSLDMSCRNGRPIH